MGDVSEAGGIGGQVRTIENPERLLRRLKRNGITLKLWLGLFFASVALGVIVADPQSISLFFIVVMLSAVVSFALFLRACHCYRKLINNGAYLVERWFDVTGEAPDTFPRNHVELASCRDLKEKIFSLARSATYWFDAREKAELALKRAEDQKPVPPEWPPEIHSSDLPRVREEYQTAFEQARKKYNEKVAELRFAHRYCQEHANEAHLHYVEFWNFIRDLGEFYGVNVLPTDDKGKPFDDYDRFRKYLRERSSTEDAS